MAEVEEYSSIPITSSRMIAWDSPSTWIDSPTISPTTIPAFQPLTKDNLTLHAHSMSDSKNYMMDWYHTSMKNGIPSPPPSPNSVTTDFNKHRSRKISTTTQNVAIDAYPLPFPYHNDSTFLPTVETGRTRFDSESTQSLYDSQPSSPTSCKRYQYTATRGNRRRGSSTSHYSAYTLTTTATTKTDTDLVTGVIPKDPPAAKRQLKTLIHRPSRLSTLQEKPQPSKVTLYHPPQQYHQHRQSCVTRQSTLVLSPSDSWAYQQVYQASPSDNYQKPSPPRRQESPFMRFAKRIWPFKQY